MVKWFQVNVTTPGSVLEFKMQHGSNGRQLFDQVCKTIGLREVWFFGLQYTDPKGVTKWVKLTKKISPPKSKDAQLKFVFKVKFYPEEVTEELIQEVTQTLFYYEVKQQVISGEIYCAGETALLLASYQALIRHGKYEPKTHQPGYLNIPNFIPDHILNQHKLTHEEWESRIASWHKEHGDMSKQDAIMEYLKVVQDLEMYGVTYFAIKNNRQTPLWIGVDAVGLNIYEADDRLTPKISFPWNEVRQLAFSHSKFTVKPTSASVKDIVFHCQNTTMCKVVLNLCTGNHELYARRRGPESIEVQQMKAQAKEAKDAREAEKEKLCAERRARELMEERYLKMEKAMQEQELAYDISQSALTEYQNKVKNLEVQLEQEKQARYELESMQRRLQEVNEQLERESAASVGERQRLRAERDAVMGQIEEQQRIIQEKENEKLLMQEQLAKGLEKAQLNGDKIKRESGEQELQILDGLHKPEEDRHHMAETDKDHAKRLDMMRRDLDATRDRQKLQQVDIRYEENLSKGLDKYRTLHNIRQGNTKKRVEQFECM